MLRGDTAATLSLASARVIGITLGHDHRVHDLPAFKTLLVNRGAMGGASVSAEAAESGNN